MRHQLPGAGKSRGPDSLGPLVPSVPFQEDRGEGDGSLVHQERVCFCDPVLKTPLPVAAKGLKCVC